MNHVLKEVNAILAAEGVGTVVAIADDIVGCVTPQMERRVLVIVTERFHTLHLSINYDKCYVLADTPDLVQRVDLSGDPALANIKATLEGVKVLGAAISESPEFHAAHIRVVMEEASPALQAITTFGKEHLQQAIALHRSTYMTKFSYLTRVTPPMSWALF